MDGRSKETSGQEDHGNQSAHDSIKELATYNARAPLDTEEQILLFLKSWWSRTYNRPLKDPLLEQYTYEELMYEFYDRIERQKAAEESVEQESDKIEQDKEQQVQDWAEQEEKRELAELAAKDKAKAESMLPKPSEDPANKAWMEEQIRREKEILGNDFGEDVSVNFEE